VTPLALSLPAQGLVDVEALLEPVAGAAGVVVLAGVVAAVLGVVHRWYAGTRVPEGLAVLVGAGTAAFVLNTTAALGSALGGAPISVGAALANVATFGAAGVVAAAGARAGDRVAAATFTDEVDVRRVVAAVGRTTTVRLPEEIADLPDHDPVAADVKADLAGKELRFPRGLEPAELRERLVERLRTDHGVGRIDVDVTDDGAVTYLAVGSRVAGLGPTLPPGTAAVAVRADPAAAASAGDLVQVWRPGDAVAGEVGNGDGSGDGPEEGEWTAAAAGDDAGDAVGVPDAVPSPAPERVASGEVRGVAGDTVTLAVDAADAERLDDRTRYRLLTLPGEVRADRAFASVLRAAEETMAAVTVHDGSALAGQTVGALAPAVVAVRTPDGSVEAIPRRSRVLAAGESVYVVARPDEIRRLETAAGGDGRTAPGSDDDD
jgi:hypothetical protein